MQLEVFWCLLLQADAEGPTDPYLMCSLVAHYLQLIKARCHSRNIVFSDIRKANLIFGGCLFCIFVKNAIYAIKIEVLLPALLAKYLYFL